MKLNELIMLARVMSQRYGVSVQISKDGRLASCRVGFGAKGQRQFMITLPVLKDNAVSDSMIRGYLDHEVGHILYTDWGFDDEIRSGDDLWVQDGYFRDLWNIFEDVFVEKKMGEVFPGSKINLQNLARQVFTPAAAYDSVRPTVNGVATYLTNFNLSAVDNLCSYIYAFVTPYCLFKRRAMNDPVLAHSDDLFNDMRNALAGAHPAIAVAFDKIDSVLAQPANSSRETYALAKQICTVLSAMERELKLDVMRQSKAGQDSQDMQTVGGEPTSQDMQAGQDSGSKLGSGQNDGGSFDHEVMAKASDELVDALDRASQAVFGESARESYGRRMHIEIPSKPDIVDALSDMLRNGRDGVVYLDRSSASYDANSAIYELCCINARTQDDLSFLAVASAQVRDKIALLRAGFMRTIPGLLQSVQYTARRVGYTGSVSGRDLYKVGAGDGRIFQKKAERKEQRVDVATLLDVSGSMADDIEDAQVTLYAMLGMLKNLPKVQSYAAHFSGIGYNVVSRFLDKRVSDYRMARAGGMTPTAGAVLKALAEFSTNSDVRRIMFIITDGEPDDGRAFTCAMDIAHSQGVETYGIGFRGALKKLEGQFGPDKVANVDDVKELPGKMAVMMQKALVHAVA